jgi:hypothetical protein
MSDSRKESQIANFPLRYEVSSGAKEKKARSTGRRVLREDGTEALEYIESDDPEEIKVAKRLMGATESPKDRVFLNGKEIERGGDFEEV